MLLTGTFVRSVDDKLRIALPKRLRDALAVDENSHLFITPSTDGSLAIYREDALAAMAARLAAASPTQQDVRAYNRLFYAQAECVELDSQGRFRVPPALAKLAALEKEAVLLGVQRSSGALGPVAVGRLSGGSLDPLRRNCRTCLSKSVGLSRRDYSKRKQPRP